MIDNKEKNTYENLTKTMKKKTDVRRKEKKTTNTRLMSKSSLQTQIDVDTKKGK